MNASSAKNNIEIINSAEVYFSNLPLGRKDSRDEIVSSIYDEAFVRWFLTVEGEPDENAQKHIELYQKYTKESIKRGD